MLTLNPHMVYRMAHNAENKTLAGRLVVFYDVQCWAAWGGYRRARVRLLNPDGSTQSTDWYVWPYLLIAA
jgi:hypothetical protein